MCRRVVQQAEVADNGWRGVCSVARAHQVVTRSRGGGGGQRTLTDVKGRHWNLVLCRLACRACHAQSRQTGAPQQASCDLSNGFKGIAHLGGHTIGHMYVACCTVGGSAGVIVILVGRGRPSRCPEHWRPGKLVWAVAKGTGHLYVSCRKTTLYEHLGAL